ncbi:alpha amylase C-terminal domain-containing protein [Bacillus licheniformis]|nr:alpha amylase C-terminal domain-containing protein [Bacillus licheniformis]
MRYGKQPGEALIIVCNFTPSVYHEYRVGVPFKPNISKCLTAMMQIRRFTPNQPKTPSGKKGVLHGKPYSISMTVPPLGAAVSEQSKERSEKG